ncbi:MAG: GMC oxidoreductase [Candidatus Velthaea sp.]
MRRPLGRGLPEPGEHFDAIVIGSGFGGSVMAYRLAKAGKRVAVLERGKRYPPGTFPRTPREVRNGFWRPSTQHHGLFDLWSFKDAEAVVASGVGGGSLIYANVLIRKDERWFVHHGGRGQAYEDWPVSRADLEPHYVDVENVLRPQVYPMEYQRDNKTDAMRAAAMQLGIKETQWDRVDPTIPQWYLPQLAVTFRAGAEPPVPGVVFDRGAGNMHGKERQTCRLCGECDIGCNYGSKNTLDYNYLTFAERLGAEIREKCEVEEISPNSRHGSSLYDISYSQHDVDPPGKTLRTISAKRVILACGTLGTMLLLLRSAGNLKRLSRMLGKRFSGNGDYLAFAMRAMKCDEHGTPVPRRLNASRAPVITSTFRFPDELDGAGNRGRGGYLQDAGYPVVGDYLMEMLDPVSDAERIARFVWERILGSLTRDRNSEMGAEIARLLGEGDTSSTSMPLLGVGRDLPNGVVRLDRKRRLQLSWPDQPSTPYYRRIDRIARSTSAGLGATYAQNPLTRIFNRLVTVHPLGGAPMGRSARDGVVNSYGEVFGHPGLYVADGSVMPGPVGANPSLTIAALSDRFATHMLETWDNG